MRQGGWGGETEFLLFSKDKVIRYINYSSRNTLLTNILHYFFVLTSSLYKREAPQSGVLKITVLQNNTIRCKKLGTVLD